MSRTSRCATRLGDPRSPSSSTDSAPRTAGSPCSEVALALRTAVEGDESGNLRRDGDEIPIRVRLAESYRGDESALANLTLQTRAGPIKLSDVATFTRTEGPQVIERENRDRQITIWATPVGRPLGDVAKEFQPQIAAIELPSDMSVFYDGQLRLMNETNTNMGLALLLGVVFIYIVLASQFESFLHPLTIMLTLPLALVGGVLALFLTDNTMAMGALIGIVLLMGLVTKNAILLIDRAIVRVREHGEPPLQAVLEAGPERLRPILDDERRHGARHAAHGHQQQRRQRVSCPDGDRRHRRRDQLHALVADRRAGVLPRAREPEAPASAQARPGLHAGDRARRARFRQIEFLSTSRLGLRAYSFRAVKISGRRTMIARSFKRLLPFSSLFVVSHAFAQAQPAPPRSRASTAGPSRRADALRPRAEPASRTESARNRTGGHGRSYQSEG